MKRFRLPKGAKAAIWAWLALPTFKDVNRKSSERHKEGTCPFGDRIGIFKGPDGWACDEICAKMFPSIGSEPTKCPCNQLSLDYVIRRAKEAVR